MRPTDLTLRLNRLAELVPVGDRRRRVLENIDLIAQGAVDAIKTYVNKHGDEIMVPQPDWSTAIKAQVAAAALLGLVGAKDEKPADTVPPVVARILAAVPK